MARQIPLNLTPDASSFDPADFIVSAANAEAHAAIEDWPNSPGAVMALVGPEGAGKSHLAHIWADRMRARKVGVGESLLKVGDHKYFLVEDSDRSGFDEVQLFHIYNWAREQGGALLLTARTAPNLWRVSLPDLRSRLATFSVAEISPPDDMLLTLLLSKLFSDRQIRVDAAVVDYAVKRMPRSFKAAYDLVDAVDKAALAEQRKITIAVVKAWLEDAMHKDGASAPVGD